jgi:hypothetical protein
MPPSILPRQYPSTYTSITFASPVLGAPDRAASNELSRAETAISAGGDTGSCPCG